MNARRWIGLLAACALAISDAHADPLSANPIGAGIGGGHTIQDEAIDLASRARLNFTGTGVTCANSVSSTDCVIPGGAGGAVPFTDISTGTNTSATMTVGNGASIVASGTGFVRATRVPDGGTTSLTTGGATGQIQTLDRGPLEWLDGSGQRRSAFEVNVVDFGATPSFNSSPGTPDTTPDDTAGIQAAIASCPNPNLTFAGVEMGCTVRIPAGKYQVGNAGQMGQCCGGSAPGTACDEDSDCPGGPNGMVDGTPTPTCAWITSNNRALRLVGDGMLATEIAVMHGGAAGKEGRVNGIAFCPFDGHGELSNFRLLKGQNQRQPAYFSDPALAPGTPAGTVQYTNGCAHLAGAPACSRPYGNGIVIQGDRMTVKSIQIESFGGMGIFLDGEMDLNPPSTTNANSCTFEHLKLENNAGDGMRILSHGAWPGDTGIGNGSSHFFSLISSQQNWGVGVNLRSSKNTLLEGEFNTNAVGGINISGSQNIVTAYFETATLDYCAMFDVEGANLPTGNYIRDNSACMIDQARLVNEYPQGGNVVDPSNQRTAQSFLPLIETQRETCSATTVYKLWADALTGRMKVCQNGRVSDLALEAGQPSDWTSAAVAVYRGNETAGNRRNDRVSTCGKITGAPGQGDCDLTDVNTVGSTASGTVLGTVMDFVAAIDEHLISLDATAAQRLRCVGSCTIGGWARATTDITSRMLHKGLGGPGGYLLARQNGNDDILCNFSDGDTTSVTSAANALPINTWVHIACRLDDPTDTQQLLVNGATSGASGTQQAVGAGDTSAFTISSATAGLDWQGQQKETFVFNGALSDAEDCRVCSCGWDGTRCMCDPDNEANYYPCTADADCQRFSTNGRCSGGACRGINAASNPGCGSCALPPCDQGPPS